MSIFADSESNTPTPPESANAPTTSGSGPPPASRGLQHGTGSGPTLIEWMALVAGLAVAFALFGELLRSDDNKAAWHVWPLAILGGLSLPMPWLITRRLRSKHRRQGATTPPTLMDWTPWEFLVTVQGWAAWMTWPPVMVMKWNGQKISDSTTYCTYFFGTPLMSLAVLAALIQARGIKGLRQWARLGEADANPTRPARPPLPWTTTFAMILGALWALSGLHFVMRMVWEDWRR